MLTYLLTNLPLIISCVVFGFTAGILLYDRHFKTENRMRREYDEVRRVKGDLGLLSKEALQETDRAEDNQ